MARNDDDYDDDDRPRRKKGSRKKSSGGGGGTQTVLIILAAVGGVCLLLCLGMAALLLPAVQQAREAARRSQSKNNLAQIGLAMHNYHDTFNRLPPGKIVREDGVEVCGWQASILPYLEQAQLFNQLDFHEGWDTPANQGPYSTVVPVYLHASVSQTTDSSGRPLMHYAGNSQVFMENKCLGFRDVTDGTSNTILVGEVTNGLKPWGMPGNVRDPADGIGPAENQFKGPSVGGTQFLLGDGMVRFISENVDPEILRALATPAGGELVGDF